MTSAAPRHRQPTIRRRLMLCLGYMLLIATPPVAMLPGPGGTMTFGLGLGLVLKYSPRAKRRYVRLKRRWPRPGAWADWGLRRASARRRMARRKALARAARD